MTNHNLQKQKRFSNLFLSKNAWIRAADDLVEAMALLEPQINDYWKRANEQLLAGNEQHPIPPPGVARVHMMLAGFAVENLCKGYLAGRLTSQQRAQAKSGVLPKSLRTHNVLALVNQTGLSCSETEAYVLKRLGEAVWRGRYAISVDHEQIQPFAQFSSDVRRIRALLQKLRRHINRPSA